ncbi:MAG: glycoside hydrolase family 31 protein [Lachnospiraceae bacterium]
MLYQGENKLIYHYDDETVWIESWGKNALRVRAYKCAQMPKTEWALTGNVSGQQDAIVDTEKGTIQNGKIRAVVSRNGKLTVWNGEGKKLLEEYSRNRKDVLDEACSALEINAREFKPIPGGDFHLTQRFESLDKEERLYGMGQYQQPYLDLKGLDLELAHRNSQASVPFLLSSRGYGLLWNNPGIGRAVLGKNIMSFEAYSTKILDYWIVAEDTPAQIEEAYASVTGRVPMMPEYGLGFWQCKLRYQTQEELLAVAREYKRRKLPIDVIVIDFFHWPKQGTWRFDEAYWPDPEGMIGELNEMGIKLMVSIWPTVERKSENYEEMLEKGYLIRTERGVRTGLDFQNATIHYDATNPGARSFLWGKVKKNYYEKGIRLFWLDEAEPEYTVYDFDNYRYYSGSNLQIGNVYPREYARTFYEGMEQEGQKNIVNLVRCAWAGSQKYGTLVWSGDIASSFESMKNQLAAGLNMGIAGIPWWTTDIGGFHGGNPDDPAFRELFVRWFEWGTFCPVMRLHGDREPRQPQVGMTGGAACCSGAANEVWSYGEDVLAICRYYMEIRESLRNYTRSLMQEAHKKGTPVMRTLFYEFPTDKRCWETEDEYMYGGRYLIAPVMNGEEYERTVYLPEGTRWKDFYTEEFFEGGCSIRAACPLNKIPVFERI